MSRRLAGLVAAIALATPGQAAACGGFFCNSTGPNVSAVDQSGEGIFFAIDEAAGKVEMHVQVEYEGSAEEFAWVVPVQADPELLIGTSALFPVLEAAGAQFQLDRIYGGGCWDDVDASASSSWATGSGTSAGTGTGGGYGGTAPAVTVVRSEQVGPYETVTLQANSSTALITWLQDNGFDIPTAVDPALAPYVAQDSFFVALRLAKDSDVGDLAPLVLRYSGTQAAIPIQLTSVAATPDMRLDVYIAGQHRAVPESYLHVELNELAVDWWQSGSNIDGVITQAANEAGGHGFFTDFSGAPDDLPGSMLYRPTWDNTDLAAALDAQDLLADLVAMAVPITPEMIGLIADHTGLPEDDPNGFDVLDALNCAAGSYVCSTDDFAQLTADPVAFAADFETTFLEPRRRAFDLLFSQPTLTRMTSSLSPAEMTVDPTFVFNPDMPEVALVRRATETTHCEWGTGIWSSPRMLELSDGRTLALPSQEALWDAGITELDWLASMGLTLPAASLIEITRASGLPETVVDNRPALNAASEGLGRRDGDEIDGTPAGCGCTSAPLAPGLALLLPLALVVRRRQD